MDLSDLITIGVAIVSGAGGSYVSTKVALAVAVNDIKWLKEADKTTREIAKRAHERIDAL